MAARVRCSPVLLLFCLLGPPRASDAAEAAAPSIEVPDSLLLFDSGMSAPRQFNPWTAAGLSALLPGGGQLYCSQPLRGGLFLTAEITMGLVAANRLAAYGIEDDEVNRLNAATDRYRSQLRAAQTDSIRNEIAMVYNEYRMATKLARHDRRGAKCSFYHAVGWLSGSYLWNILNALQCSNAFHDDGPRVPARAAWLSAIPALGLGQIYNGSLSKAGMIWTVQTMLIYQSYNYHRLTRNALNGLREAEAVDLFSGYESQWLGRYDEALRKRNMYLWYAIFFYFYGVFDAAVDAHLHDYRRKLRLEPVVDHQAEAVGMNLRIDF